jgi:hypothetical protein
MERKEFADYFGIPYRTLQDWELENRKCPEYLLNLIEYKLLKENVSFSKNILKEMGIHMYVNLKTLKKALDLTGWSEIQKEKARQLVELIKSEDVDIKSFPLIKLSARDFGQESEMIIKDGVARVLAFDSIYTDDDLFECEII